MLMQDTDLLQVFSVDPHASLGIHDDTGVLLFSALEGGVSLLEILDHPQEPSGDALTRLHERHDAFCTVYKTRECKAPD